MIDTILLGKLINLFTSRWEDSSFTIYTRGYDDACIFIYVKVGDIKIDVDWYYESNQEEECCFISSSFNNTVYCGTVNQVCEMFSKLLDDEGFN